MSEGIDKMKNCVYENMKSVQSLISTEHSRLLDTSITTWTQCVDKNMSFFNEKEQIQSKYLDICVDEIHQLRDSLQKDLTESRLDQSKKYDELFTYLQDLKSQITIKTEQTLYQYRLFQSQYRENLNAISAKRRELVNIQTAITAKKIQWEENEKLFATEISKSKQKVLTTKQTICKHVNDVRRRENLFNKRVLCRLICSYFN